MYLKPFIFLTSPTEYHDLIRAHNPLVVGSSPTGPTKLKAAHCAAFVYLGVGDLDFQNTPKTAFRPQSVHTCEFRPLQGQGFSRLHP